MAYDRAATFALVAEQLADDLACAPSDLASGAFVGVAGVSADSARLWQIGVDVRAPFRGAGIAAAQW